MRDNALTFLDHLCPVPVVGTGQRMLIMVGVPNRKQRENKLPQTQPTAVARFRFAVPKFCFVTLRKTSAIPKPFPEQSRN